MLSHPISTPRTARLETLAPLDRPAIRAKRGQAISPRAGTDLATAWPMVRDTMTRGAGFTMLAAVAVNAVTSLPAKKAEYLTEKGRPMEPLQQFGFLCEKAIPEGLTGAAVGIAAALYMSQAGFAPSAAWGAAALTAGSGRAAWWLRNRV